MAVRITAPAIRAMKGREESIVCLTAYDVLTGSIADEAGVDLVLVGDSLGNVVLGHETTVPVTLEDVLHHVKATRRGVKRAFLMADMPFGSYGGSVEQAVNSAVALMRAGAEGVKLEGAYLEEISAIAKAGIPVMGHLGMTPQSVHQFGGFKLQGKGKAGEALVETARALEDAGVFAMVLELIPAELAARISQSISVPTIGIGAGAGCDGQIQVFHDIAGFGTQVFKHAKAYVNGRSLLTKAVQDYACEVRSKGFPTAENSF